MKNILFLISMIVGLLGFVSVSNAQTGPYRITNSGCVAAGNILTISGRDFGTGQFGSIVAVVSGQAVNLPVQQWSPRRVRVTIPQSPLLTPGSTYPVIWQDVSTRLADFGRITICETASRTPTISNERAEADEVSGPNGQPEYVVSVPPGQAQAASNVMQSLGATLLRTRNLQSLQRVLLVFVLPRGLTVQQAQAALAGVANGATIDVHNIYGFAQAARVYVSDMLKDDPSTICVLRSAVRIGIIDGPVNPGHPALAGVNVIRFSALQGNEPRISPDHGTAVAALIAGSPNAGPMAGLAAGARLYTAEAFSGQRRGLGASLENIAVSLDWLLGQNVRLINMSFAGDPNGALANLLNAAAGRGAVMIAAAGNSGGNTVAYPAGAPEVIAVGAVDASGRLYRRSNTGPHIEFTAPGVEVYTAKGNGGGYQTGTSFAAPIVTALAARIAARGNLSTNSLRNALMRSALDLGPTGRDTGYGWGLVQSNGC